MRYDGALRMCVHTLVVCLHVWMVVAPLHGVFNSGINNLYDL